ncbi:MAG: stage II sporulation protein M [Chloroflexi bacterium]|nr:stage II sporulation protein M [Chloroflexota bacterium]
MRLKWWVLVAAVLFALGFVLGLATPASAIRLFSEEFEALKGLTQILKPFQVTTAVFIFLKNVSAVLLSFIFSPIFLLLPLLSLLLNGWLLAFVAVMVTQQKSVLYVLAGVLPHGIFEIPAFIVGQAAALSFGTVAILALFGRRDPSHVSASLRRNLRYVAVAVVLLAPAALVETFVTPLLIR